MYRRLIAILLFFSASYFYGQDTLTYPVIDKLTYNYYTTGQWDSLIKLGKLSHHKHIDFYYLQVRMGIAYFEKKQYLKAIKYLEKAYQTDKKNTIVQETLYWSYIYSFLYNDADRLYDDLDTSVKTKINYTRYFIQVISLRYIYGSNQDFNILSEEKLIGDNEINAERDILKNESSIGIQAIQSAGKGIFLTHNLSFLTLNYQKTIDNLMSGIKQFDLKTSQKQYYFQAGIPIGKRWLLSPAATLLWGYTQDYKLFIPYQPFMPPQMQIVNTKFSNFLASITIKKTWSLWANQTNISISNLDTNGRNLQAGNKISIFPIGNKKLILSGNIQFSPDINNQPALVKTVSLKTNFKYFAIYGFYTKGKIQNFSELNGAIVYNQPEMINSQYGGGLSAYYKKFRLNAEIIQQHMIRKYEVKDISGTIINKNFNFDVLILKGGISWHF